MLVTLGEGMNQLHQRLLSSRGTAAVAACVLIAGNALAEHRSSVPGSWASSRIAAGSVSRNLRVAKTRRALLEVLQLLQLVLDLCQQRLHLLQVLRDAIWREV